MIGAHPTQKSRPIKEYQGLTFRALSSRVSSVSTHPLATFNDTAGVIPAFTTVNHRGSKKKQTKELGVPFCISNYPFYYPNFITYTFWYDQWVLFANAAQDTLHLLCEMWQAPAAKWRFFQLGEPKKNGGFSNKNPWRICHFEDTNLPCLVNLLFGISTNCHWLLSKCEKEHQMTHYFQWPFQEPKLEVYLPYIRPI